MSLVNGKLECHLNVTKDNGLDEYQLYVIRLQQWTGRISYFNGSIKAFDEGGKELPHLKSLTVRVYRGDCRHLTPWAWSVSEFDMSEFI